MPQVSSLISISGLFKITRVWNLLIIVLTQVFVAVFLLGKEWYEISGDWKFLVLVVSTVIVAAGGYIINDYYDVKIDYINKPERVVIGKQLKRRVVMAIHLVLNFLGLVGGILVSIPVFLINAFSIGMLWLYSNQLKRLPFIGNFSVSLLTGLSIFVVGVYYQQYTMGIMLYTLFAFFFTLVREIIKDMQDVKGDEAFGAKTLPIIWGLRRTKRFVYFMMVLFTAGLFLGFEFLDGVFWTFFFTGLVIVQLILAALIYRADTIRHFGMLSQLCKIIMLGGILTMLVYGL